MNLKRGIMFYVDIQLTVVYEVSVAQWVKRWPADLAMPSFSPARGEIF